MRAIINQIAPVRYIPLKLMGRFSSGAYWGPLAPLRFSTAWPLPKMPGPQWVRLKPILSGICGSDVGVITLRTPPDSFTRAFLDGPFVMGHECVARITELGGNVTGFSVGDRVNVEPSLCCSTRDIDPPCPMCRDGLLASCLNIGGDQLPPGMAIGYNSFTGGAWSDCFVAHQSQLYKVPHDVTDDQAVLVDPLAVALHAVYRRRPKEGERVLIIGAGIIGLGLVSALRAMNWQGEIVVAARHAAQKEMCLARGADHVILPRDYARSDFITYVGKWYDCRSFRGVFGKSILLGGADLTYDSIGSRNSTEDALRITHSGGTVVIVGMDHPRWVDWDPVTHKQLQIIGVHGRAFESADPQRRHNYQMVHEMLQQGRLNTDGLLTHQFPLADYRHALRTVTNKSRTGCIKAAFRI